MSISPSKVKKRKLPEETDKKETTHALCAYLGQEGSYSEEAALGFFSSDGHSIRKSLVKTHGVNSFYEIFEQVESGKCQYGIVPIENSESGVFRSIYDLLIKSKLFIVGECMSQEEHCLVALDGVTKEEIKKIFSHPDVLEQCQSYIRELGEHNKSPTTTVYKRDTASSCAFVARKNKREFAAIASRRAAALHKLKVIERASHEAQTSTRYVVIAKEPLKLPDERLTLKTSICVSVRNESGALFKALSCFALRNINLLKVEARPASKAKQMFSGAHHWEYIFYFDYNPPTDPKVSAALLANLKEFCHSVRELGTYVASIPSFEVHQSDWHTIPH